MAEVVGGYAIAIRYPVLLQDYGSGDSQFAYSAACTLALSRSLHAAALPSLCSVLDRSFFLCCVAMFLHSLAAAPASVGCEVQ